MKHLIVTALVAFFASTAVQAANPSCEAKATEKKLAGAAKNSFMKKCEKNAAAAPSAKDAFAANAADKNLAGAAKNKSTKKCAGM